MRRAPETKYLFYGKSLETFLGFIDFQLAYDSIKRDESYRAMTKLGVKGKLLRLTKMTLRNNRQSES